MRKRIAILLVFLMLLPGPGVADAFSFQASLDLPQTAQKDSLQPLTDLLRILQFRGTLLAREHDGGFDLKGDVSLDPQSQSRTAFHLYGVEGMMKLESPLWNELPVLINVPAALEYGVKIHAHMDIPLERVFLLYPWVTRDAFSELIAYLDATMHAEEGTHTVSSETLMECADTVSGMLYESRALHYWFDSLATLNDAGEQLQEIFYMLPSFCETYCADGLDVHITDTMEAWVAGDTEIYRREETAEETRFLLHLPGILNGADLRLTYGKHITGDTYDARYSLGFGEGEDAILTGQIDLKSMPCTLPAKAPYSIRVDISGRLLEGLPFLDVNEAGHLQSTTLKNTLNCSISRTDTGLILASHGEILGRLLLQTQEIEGAELPVHTFEETDGLNFFSLNDETLKEFMRQSQSSLFHGLLPILEYLPVSTTQVVMNTLTEGGFFDLLLYGSEEETYDEEYEAYEDYEEDYEE